jgi:tRNA splicing endonuclease
MSRKFSIDDEVLVLSPKHNDSIHSRQFVGRIVSVPYTTKLYEVLDATDNDVFSVREDELQLLEESHGASAKIDRNAKL